MRLLFDENLAGRLPQLLEDTCPDSADVVSLGLAGSSDRAIWDRAAPPKVIWIRLGNCAAADVARLLRFRVEQVLAFVDHPDTTFLAVG